MYAYDENRQAYIADPMTGTFRELVEAADGCQVAIIHPGMPRDPSESGIEQLIARPRCSSDDRLELGGPLRGGRAKVLGARAHC